MTVGTGRTPAQASSPVSNRTETGAISVAVGGASDDLPLAGSFTLIGPVRRVDAGRVLSTPVSVRSLAGEDG